ncbi:MAG: alpha-amylase family protein [Candidatus Competibacteraceae bacterium]|nr:alpha-amylase family protein [Candidatus Competibacteraceae bacterium]
MGTPLPVEKNMNNPSLFDEADQNRLFDRLLTGSLDQMESLEQAIFRIRFDLYLPDVLRPLMKLYGERPDFAAHLENLLSIVARAYASRPEALRLLDLRRVSAPDWFQQPNMIGYVCYVDRFAGDLAGVRNRIPYLKELGVTYLHLMPLLKPRPGANDGGYAVLDYREVNSAYGTLEDLRELTAALRQEGISLCIDLVCNHTAKEHEWARQAVAGDPTYQDYYYMFPNRVMPDQYEMTLPEVFPDFAPGNFTFYDSCQRWVWTTFNEYQWDLNYANPAVLAEMLDIMLFLANQGVEILRLDAVAFLWKRLGTDCQNQPEAHAILQAFRALTRIAAPGLLFKAEAIVSPDQLLPYLGLGAATNRECEIAYHNSLMVLLWSSLAERRVVLMTHALQNMPDTPVGCAWLTYIRCHDDIGWAVRDEDAAAVGLSGFLHRAFLSDFYSGRFPGAFARGMTFQYNPKTGDRRISGALASLAGLEAAAEQHNWQETDLAVRRILLLHAMILAFNGIPMIYMGDELGLLNDPSYQDDPNLADDNRWAHRPFMDWHQAEQRHDWQTLTARIFQAIRSMIQTAKHTLNLHAQARCYAVWTHNEQVFGLIRASARGKLLVLANFSEHDQTVPRHRVHDMGFTGELINRLEEQSLDSWSDLKLEPYQALWLEQVPED